MGLLEWYHYINYEIADPKVNDWLLVRTPIPITIITIAYLYFVLKYGPKYMKNRPAYSLGTFIKIYNIFQIVVNTILVYLLLDNRWYQDYFFYYTEYDLSPTPQNMQFCRLLWLGACLKIIDYIETCLFVLRKKESQVSILHLYHHVAVVYYAWLNLKYFCSGVSMTSVIVNGSIHIIMYTYYLLSTMGPKMQKLLHPAKRIITLIQIAQFVVLIGHSITTYCPDCPGSKIGAISAITNLTINLILFLNFYRKNYGDKMKQK